MNPKIKKLIFSIIIDFIGMFSYLVPVIGEFIDVIWAFISAKLVYKLYGSLPFAIFNGLEEILPFTDWIPTATLNWIYFYYIKKEK